jgi:hypothetical protein
MPNVQSKTDNPEHNIFLKTCMYWDIFIALVTYLICDYVVVLCIWLKGYRP